MYVSIYIHWITMQCNLQLSQHPIQSTNVPIKNSPACEGMAAHVACSLCPPLTTASPSLQPPCSLPWFCSPAGGQAWLPSEFIRSLE